MIQDNMYINICLSKCGCFNLLSSTIALIERMLNVLNKFLYDLTSLSVMFSLLVRALQFKNKVQ